MFCSYTTGTGAFLPICPPGLGLLAHPHLCCPQSQEMKVLEWFEGGLSLQGSSVVLREEMVLQEMGP